MPAENVLFEAPPEVSEIQDLSTVPLRPAANGGVERGHEGEQEDGEHGEAAHTNTLTPVRAGPATLSSVSRTTIRPVEERPGEYPYTRGIRADGYATRPWTMRQYAGFASAEETNERFRLLLERGQTGLSVAFDLPTQLGLDSDDPLARGEVGRTGVAIDSLDDMLRLFDGIPLGEVSTSMTINAPAAVLLLLYELAGAEHGVAPEELRGTVQNDVLKEYAARGNYIFPPRPSMRLTVDLFRYCNERLPRFNTISISGYHIREAGSSAAQELGFTLANGIAYVEAALAAGLEVDVFAPRLSFFFNAHNDVFAEVAKFRAARRIWATLMRERFGARDERSLALRFHAQTGGSTLTAQGPLDERRARRAAGLRRDRGRLPVAAHERLRRGARAAHRALRDARPAHAAGAAARVGRRGGARPVRRLGVRRGPDRRDRARGARS